MRELWPTDSKEKLSTDLAAVENETRGERVERVRFLIQEFGPPADMLLIGGVGAMFAIQELQRAFLYGNFMATIFLCQTFAEHSLAGSYALSGQDEKVEKGFKFLIDETLRDGGISEIIAKRFHELREMRNPYTHPRVIKKRQSLLDRIVQTTGNPDTMAEKDAREAIRIVVDYLREQSPNWTPSRAAKAK
jgi:hypothetical protein